MSDVAESLDAASEGERIDVDRLIAEAGLALGGFDPVATGRQLGMNDRAIKFAIGLLQGMDATAALRATGHNATGNVLRSAASKMARSKRVQKFLERAEQQKAGVPDGPMDEAEKLRILGKLARSNNPQIQVRAVQAHQQLQNDMVGRARDAENNGDPVDTLKQIARVSPLCAVVADELARVHGLNFNSAELPAVSAEEANQQAAVRKQFENRARLRGVENGHARN